MNREIYFYDQFTRVSHLGGISRHKRHPEELNQALHHVRIALAAEDNSPANSDTPTTLFNPTPSPVKQQVVKQTNESLLKTIQNKFNAPILPDLLFRELDSLIQRFDDKSKTSTTSSTTTPKIPSSIPSKSARTTQIDDEEEEEEETDVLPIQEADDEDELIAAQSRTPKVSLPGSLILAFHSTWSDLIEDTEYTYRVRNRWYNISPTKSCFTFYPIKSISKKVFKNLLSFLLQKIRKLHPQLCTNLFV